MACDFEVRVVLEGRRDVSATAQTLRTFEDQQEAFCYAASDVRWNHPYGLSVVDRGQRLVHWPDGAVTDWKGKAVA